ncbi:MAG: tetratricopeptide repeat protein [Bacteroidales bacterium]|nr:tetratricopeptide repeat protein [Bacteroidales bacterium]
MKYILLGIIFLVNISVLRPENPPVIDSLENKLSELQGEERFTPLFDLVKLYSRLDLQKSNALAREYFHLADSLNNRKHRIIALNALANTYYFMGDNFEALKYLDRTINEIEARQNLDQDSSSYDRNMLSKAYNNKANILNDIGERDEAVEMYFKVEKYTTELLEANPGSENLINLLAGVYNNIGLVYYHSEKMEEAYRFLEIALELCEQNKTDAGIAMSLNSIAMVKTYQNKYPEALEDFKRALQISEALDDRFNIAANLDNIGWVYDEMEQYNSALVYYNKSLEISRDLQHPYGIANALFNIGGLQTRLKKSAVAETALMEALKIVTENHIVEI